MNVERLHALVIALKRDLETTGLSNLLANLSSNMSNLAQQPGQPQYQQEVAAGRAALRDAVAESAVDRWPATWQETLSELGIREHFGAALLSQVTEAFEQNEVTPQSAANSISELASSLNQDDAMLTNLLGALDYFRVGSEHLEPGVAEVMISIPRPAVREEFDELGAEFRRLNRLLGCFSEVETGSRDSFQVRSISSSDYGVYLAAIPVVAASVAKSVDWILGAYLKVLQIKESRRNLIESGVPEETLGALDEHVESRMRSEIEAYVDEYFAERFAGGKLTGRQNELKVELALTMNGIANRIDRGYNFDVRVADVEDEGDEDGDSENDPDEIASQVIREVSPRLKYVNRAGEAMLSLPEPKSTDPDATST